MGVRNRATAEDVRAALATPGVTQVALAEALGKEGRPATISDWATGRVQRPNLSRAQLAEAVARVTSGTTPRTDLDPRSYTAGLLVGLSGDVDRMAARIAEARAALGLTAPATRPAAGTRARRALERAEKAAAPAARRRGSSP